MLVGRRRSDSFRLSLGRATDRFDVDLTETLPDEFLARGDELRQCADRNGRSSDVVRSLTGTYFRHVR